MDSESLHAILESLRHIKVMLDLVVLQLAILIILANIRR